MQVAVIEGNKIVNVIEVEYLDHASPGPGQTVMPWAQAIDRYEMIDSLKPAAPTWDQIRQVRDQLLTASDFSQLEDAPGDRAAWKKYRAALRKITEDFPSPEAVKFPTKPER